MSSAVRFCVFAPVLFLVSACAAPDEKESDVAELSEVVTTEPERLEMAPIKTEQQLRDEKILGEWTLTDAGGYQRGEPLDFTIEVNDSRTRGRRYVANLNGSFAEFELEGDIIAFGRGIYATAAGREVGLRLRFAYSGTLEGDTMTGTADFIAYIDAYGDPVDPESDGRVLPALDPGGEETDFAWQAVRR